MHLEATEYEGKRSLNKLVEQLEATAKKLGLPIEQLLAAPKPVKSEPPEDQTLNVFGFGYLAGAKDPYGVPVARPEYLKRSCTQCHGRGFQVETLGKRYIVCRCIYNGYLRAARRFSVAVKSAMKGCKEEGEKRKAIEQIERIRVLVEMFGV